MADAFISDLLDADEVAMFKAYAANKLELNRISKQPEYPGAVSWPVPLMFPGWAFMVRVGNMRAIHTKEVDRDQTKWNCAR